ncbi:MAG: ATP-binding cassette domain-containing protein, partial [Alphaproteobacteria bacterium]|nr:ATP-binding cassette domain-containing protein [Alphaproteobacteria bacterium]
MICGLLTPAAGEPGGADAGPADRRGPVGGRQVSRAIDVRDLSKSFSGVAVVDKVALQLETGRICGFLGPNGSGKTTTLRMLCGLLTPDAGEGTCLGFDV